MPDNTVLLPQCYLKIDGADAPEELMRDLVKAIAQGDALRTGHEKSESDGLSVTIGEFLIGRLGEE